MIEKILIHIPNKKYLWKSAPLFFDELNLGNSKEMLSENKYILYNTIDKFSNDKCCCNIGDYTVLIDGVILNLKQLFLEYSCDDIPSLVITMYKKNGGDFFKEFRGNFCGFFEDRRNQKAFAFTNHTGDKTLFYYETEAGEIYIANHVVTLTDILKKKGINYSLDVTAAYSMLCYGYMYDSLTVIQGIKKLLPGQYMLIREKLIDIKAYYEIDNSNELSITENEAIEEIDRLFLEAVKLQVEKNQQYGYDNYIPLSAGMDSRMTAYAVNRVCKKPSVNFTYSETGQFDQDIPMEIAKELGNHWIFKNLDNGLALFDIEEATVIGDGIIYYAWPSQLNDFIKRINTQRMGVIHTGVIGDVILGSFVNSSEVNHNYEIGQGAFSLKLIDKFKSRVKEVKYKNKEIGMLYNRGLNGATLGYALTFQQYTEAISPFMNVDFMNFCMSLPFKYRDNHYLYYKWVNKYYPEAMKYYHNGVKVPTYKWPDIKIKNKQINIERVPSLIRNTIRNKTDQRFNMNPFDYWYRNNQDLNTFMNSYLNDNIELLDAYQELKQDTLKLFNEGDTKEKILALSLIAIWKLLK